MWVEIILSLFTGCLFGVTYSNFDVVRPYLELYFPGIRRKREPRRIPAIYSAPSDEDCCKNSDEDCCSSSDRIQELLNSINRPLSSDSFEDQVKAFEHEHNSRVVFINHGRQKNSIMGVDLNLFGTNDTLSTRDAQALLDILRDTPAETDIDLILHTTGGSMAAAEVMVKALLAHSGRIRVHIPYFAESAGTFLALTGNEIHIGRGGWLTQVDPQLCYVSAATLLQTFSRPFQYVTEPSTRSWFSDLANLGRIGAEKAMNRAVELMNFISTARGHSEQEGENLTELLVKGASNHDKPLTADLLNGVPRLSFGVSEDVLKLYKAHCNKR